MHWFNVVTIFLVLSLVGVEFSVSAFIHPAASRLDPQPQLVMLSRSALLLGRVMPVWYPVCALAFLVQICLYWHAPRLGTLITAGAIWILTSLASIVFLVPLNNRVAEGAADWQRVHHIWDTRHRVRIVALAIAAILLTDVLAS